MKELSECTARVSRRQGLEELVGICQLETGGEKDVSGRENSAWTEIELWRLRL